MSSRTTVLQRAQDGPPGGGAAHRRAILTNAVTSAVIPSLVARTRELAAITEAQIHDLADLAWRSGGDAVIAFVEALRRESYSAQSLYLDLLAPAAALLGQWWVDDVCSFADVTVGMVHLQSALRALGPALFEGRAPAATAGARVMLLPLPGEQHTFGLQMLADFFRRAGFDTWTGVLETAAELRRTLAEEWVDLVGFSIGSIEAVPRATQEIEAARQASRNKNLFVLVGGPAFIADPTLAQAVGADGTARNGLEAVTVAETLLRSRR